MVDYRAKQFDNLFHALANQTRRDILMQLASQDLTVNELAAEYEMSLQAVSKHIHVLVESGLVQQEKDGRTRLCTINHEPLERASELLREYRLFWEERLDSLEEYFDKIKD